MALSAGSRGRQSVTEEWHGLARHAFSVSMFVVAVVKLAPILPLFCLLLGARDK